MRSILLVVFSVVWAAVGFAVLRALIIAWRVNPRLATITAFAVAAAFALGSVSPFSLARRPAPAAAPGAGLDATPSISHAISCPAESKIKESSGTGHIDIIQVAGTEVGAGAPIRLSSSDVMRLQGWLVAANGPATSLCVVVDGHAVPFEGVYGIDRPDVATALGKSQDRGSGFDVVFHLSSGTHTVGVGPAEPDGSVMPLKQTLAARVR